MLESAPMTSTGILLIDCPDRKGLVAKISNFLLLHGANIRQASEHLDDQTKRFLMRVEWDLKDFDLDMAQFGELFRSIAEPLEMQWQAKLSSVRPRVAILVSRYTHCLADLLYRHNSGELLCEIPLIVSNHPNAERLAEFYGIPFHVTPISAESKAQVEGQQLALLQQYDIGLVVLARYMQVLSENFVRQYPQRIINVHHSFLPAFTGQRPYHQAFDRGVKLIGASSHYVTAGLDEGPIIEQDVVRISHRDRVEDLIQKGRDLEKIVLSRAVRWHIEHRILVYEKKTVVFD